MTDEMSTDEEVRDFLLNDLAFTPQELERFLDREQEIRSLGTFDSDITLTNEEMDQFFRVIRGIVHGDEEDPFKAYDRAMGII